MSEERMAELENMVKREQRKGYRLEEVRTMM
jgi:hypothetical protein